MKKQTITIKLHSGTYRPGEIELDERVEATIIGSFAVHKLNGHYSRLGWQVTHTRTGYCACPRMPTKQSAIKPARHLEPVADWNFDDPRTVKRWSQYRVQKVRRALKFIDANFRDNQPGKTK